MKRQITALIIVLTASLLFGFVGCSKTSEVADISETGSDLSETDEYDQIIQSYEAERDRLTSEAADRDDEIERLNEALNNKTVEYNSAIADHEAAIKQYVSEKNELANLLKQKDSIIKQLYDKLNAPDSISTRYWYEMDYPYKKVLSVGDIKVYNQPNAETIAYEHSCNNAYLEVLCCVSSGAGMLRPDNLEGCWLLVRLLYDETPSTEIGWVLASQVEPYNAETRSHLQNYVTVKKDAVLWSLDFDTDEYYSIEDESLNKVLHKAFYEFYDKDDEYAYIALNGMIGVKCRLSDLVYPDF